MNIDRRPTHLGAETNYNIGKVYVNQVKNLADTIRASVAARVPSKESAAKDYAEAPKSLKQSAADILRPYVTCLEVIGGTGASLALGAGAALHVTAPLVVLGAGAGGIVGGLVGTALNLAGKSDVSISKSIGAGATMGASVGSLGIIPATIVGMRMLEAFTSMRTQAENKQEIANPLQNAKDLSQRMDAESAHYRSFGPELTKGDFQKYNLIGVKKDYTPTELKEMARAMQKLSISPEAIKSLSYEEANVLRNNVEKLGSLLPRDSIDKQNMSALSDKLREQCQAQLPVYVNEKIATITSHADSAQPHTKEQMEAYKQAAASIDSVQYEFREILNGTQRQLENQKFQIQSLKTEIEAEKSMSDKDTPLNIARLANAIKSLKEKVGVLEKELLEGNSQLMDMEDLKNNLEQAMRKTSQPQESSAPRPLPTTPNVAPSPMPSPLKAAQTAPRPLPTPPNAKQAPQAPAEESVPSGTNKSLTDEEAQKKLDDLLDDMFK